MKWDLLCDLGLNNNEPWVILRDFNEILFETEKRGGANCNRAEIQRFRVVVVELGIHLVKPAT